MGSRVAKTLCVNQSTVIRPSSISRRHSASLPSKNGGSAYRSTNGIEKHCRVSEAKVHVKNIHTANLTMDIHRKARCEVYPRTEDILRFVIPDEKVPWSVDLPEYNPVDFTSGGILKQPEWADLPDSR